MLSRRFLVLTEIAAGQPAVKQSEIAERLSISVQAVSAIIKGLVSEGLVESAGPLDYRLTPRGVEVLMEGGRSMRERSRQILDEILRPERVFCAIASDDVRKDEVVGLWMEGGVLRAGRGGSGAARGRALSRARRGDDVGVIDVEGIIPLKKGMVRVLRIPSIEKGGSQRADLEQLRERAGGFLCCLGVEALVALKKVGRRPRSFFGSLHTAIEAAHHGISPVVVASEKEVPGLIEALEREGISYTIEDASTG